MADTLVQTRPINAASFGLKYTVTSTDATNEAILFDFQTSRDLTFSVTVTAPTTNAVVVTDIGVSFPDAGQVKVFGAGTGGAGLVAGQTISIVGGINCLDAAFKV